VGEWRDGEPQGDVRRALDELDRRVEEVYLRVDLDALDREVARGIVDEPVRGRRSLEQAEEAIRATSERFRIRAATLATLTPARDLGEKTSRAALRIMALVGDHAVQFPPFGVGGSRQRP
jgi:arginase family enzyme